MTHPLRFEGRRVTLRLSDLPIEVRQSAAEKLVADEIRNGSPEEALLFARALHAIAEDPIKASVEMPDECSNKSFQVPMGDWLELVGLAVAA